jgi:hypothetical protein
MRSHYDPQRIMLPLRELREHERVFVITSPVTASYGVVINAPVLAIRVRPLHSSDFGGF